MVGKGYGKCWKMIGKRWEMRSKRIGKGQGKCRKREGKQQENGMKMV